MNVLLNHFLYHNNTFISFIWGWGGGLSPWPLTWMSWLWSHLHSRADILHSSHLCWGPSVRDDDVGAAAVIHQRDTDREKRSEWCNDATMKESSNGWKSSSSYSGNTADPTWESSSSSTVKPLQCTCECECVKRIRSRLWELSKEKENAWLGR